MLRVVTFLVLLVTSSAALASPLSWDVEVSPPAEDAGTSPNRVGLSWDVTPSSEPSIDPTWDVPDHEVGDAASSSGRPLDDWRAPTDDRLMPVDGSWDVDPDADAPLPWSDRSQGVLREEPAASADALSEAHRSDPRLRQGFHSEARSSVRRQRFTLRMTPMTGLREPVSLSIAWTKPEYFELEAGAYMNPFASVRTTQSALLPDGELLQWQERQRVLETGGYVRAAISYPLFDQRGLRMRPWHADLLIPLELRVPVRQDAWTVLLVLHLGAECTRWFPGGRGLAIGALIGAPIWDLRARQQLEFRPILRGHIGIAF